MEQTLFLNKIKKGEKINFQETMNVIESNYEFTPSLFKNGSVINQAGENAGSCKLFAFAKLNNLTKEQTLACFGDYYRMDVLENPEGTNHQNIRNFMDTGWEGIRFENDPLIKK